MKNKITIPITNTIKKPLIKLVMKGDKYLEIIPSPNSARVKSVAVNGVTLLLNIIPFVTPKPIQIVVINVKKKVLLLNNSTIDKVDKIINELYKNTNGEPKIYPKVSSRFLLLQSSIIKLIINGANKNFKNERFDCSVKESFI